MSGKKKLSDADRRRLDELVERTRGATYGSSPEYPAPTEPVMDANELRNKYAALGGGSLSEAERRQMDQLVDRTRGATYGTQASYPTPRAPDTDALDRAAGYRSVGSYGYDYKDPSVPGAADGRQSGPMADELRGLPGVVKPGPDGMDRVDTGRLTMDNTSELGQHRRELDQKADRSELDELRRRMAALGGATSIGSDDDRLQAAQRGY